MSDDAQVKPPNKKRWWLYGLIGVGVLILAMLGAVYFLVLHEAVLPLEPPILSSPVEEPKPAKSGPPQLHVDYHFDRNAIVDTRHTPGKILALTFAGNPLLFSDTSFEPIGEKVFHRRVTSLGPVDGHYVSLGLANGAIVRMNTQDLTIQALGMVPGIPHKIERAQETILVAYRPFRKSEPNPHLILEDLSSHQMQSVPETFVLFVDHKGRPWLAEGERIWMIDRNTGKKRDVPWKGKLGAVMGFYQPRHHSILAFGGTGTDGAFILQVDSDTKPVLLYSQATRNDKSQGPSGTILAIVENPSDGSMRVLTKNQIFITDRTFSKWQEFDSLVESDRRDDMFEPRGQVHVLGERLVYALARGGLVEATLDRFQRHVLPNQYPLQRPVEINRLGQGMVFIGDGDLGYFEGKNWQSLPEAVTPPGELLWGSRTQKNERVWAAMMIIPAGGEHCYVIAKAGLARGHEGLPRGQIETVVTARWDGSVLNVLGREELTIEPTNTFMTPDRQLWNVNEKGLWNFAGGRWRVAMRTEEARRLRQGQESDNDKLHSPLGKPLHFVERTGLPFYATPRLSPSYALIRMDVTPMGDVPLFDDVVVKVDNRRVLIHDAILWGKTKEHLLLATDHGLCVFNVRFGTCEIIRPEGITDEVTFFKRDGTRRLWIGGKGLWVLRDNQTADPIHPWLPMLADTEVLSLAESPDGRIVVGLDGRGVIFITIPPGWFTHAESLPDLEVWETTSSHEPVYSDPTILLQPCPNSRFSTSLAQDFLHSLSAEVIPLNPRARVELEENFDGTYDVALRGPWLDPLLTVVFPALEKSARNQFAVYRRFGARGSLKVESQGCW